MKGICHRDLSFKNILLRVFSDGAVTVKLSDFGLAKPQESDFAKTETEIRGTFVDPALDRFKDFRPVNDIIRGWLRALVHFQGSQPAYK
jgi:eukaryotic-like serine/threonine-protein kinase